MIFKDNFPNLDQWLKYGGTLSVYSTSNGMIRFEVGDADGMTDDFVFECETIDEGFLTAENQARQLIIEARELQAMYLDGDVKSSDKEIIRITGLPPIQNPFYNSDQ
ncbi:hypothetical protein [Kaarinaea lacus]